MIANRLKNSRYTEYFLEAINIGIDNYLLKPYTSDEISSVLFKTIKKQYDANIHDVKNACNLIDNNLIYIGYGYSYNFIENLLFMLDKRNIGYPIGPS